MNVAWPLPNTVAIAYVIAATVVTTAVISITYVIVVLSFPLTWERWLKRVRQEHSRELVGRDKAHARDPKTEVSLGGGT